jgi:hypothetical protein
VSEARVVGSQVGDHCGDLVRWSRPPGRSQRCKLVDRPSAIAGTSETFPAAAVFPVLFLEASASAVPVFLDAGLAGVNSEAAQLGPFSQAALELGEAGEGGEPDNVVP